MTRALDSSIGLSSRSTSALEMLGLLMPEEVRRSFGKVGDGACRPTTGCADPKKAGARMAAEGMTAEIHGFSEPDAMPTPWTAGLEQLRGADTFWLSTVRPDGRPHVTPVIAVWHAGALWFTTGPQERKAKNLARNASCVLTTGRSDLVAGALDVVVEGHAEQVTDDAELEPVAGAFAAKYPNGPWDFVVRDGAFSDRDAGGRVLVFRVTPVRGLGFRKGDHFSQTTWERLR